MNVYVLSHCFVHSNVVCQGQTKETEYPGWVLVIAVLMITASVIPILIVFLLRRFQCLKLDVDIHQGAIRRIDTTVSTKEMMTDVDVSTTHQDNSCNR